ncbi:MAG: archaellin/type IV pilin N-terminal domain-containing protein [Thermoplasmata archaeon]
MKKVYKKRDEEAVSPVIATILMVAITVVLAAVLYVMVIGMGGESGGIETPLGLNQQGKTTTSVTVLVSSAPTEAKITSTSISLTKAGTPTPISNATVYSAGAVVMATYDGTAWSWGTGYTADTAMFAAGVTIKIDVAAGVSSGDKIVLSSSDKYYGTTTFTVA